MKKEATTVQIATRRASMEKLMDGVGGQEALRSLLVERLDDELLFDVLRDRFQGGVDLYDTYDAIKTFCELHSGGSDPWRLVKQSEILDEEKHIDATDGDAVFEAAVDHHFLIFMNEESANDNCWYESSDPKLVGIIIEAEPFSDTLGQLIAKQCAESVYEYETLASWFELYGLELRQRGQRSA